MSLSQHLATITELPEALAAFQTERLPIVHEYQRTSRELNQIDRRTKRAA